MNQSEVGLIIQGLEIVHRGHGQPDEDIFKKKNILLDNIIKICINHKEKYIGTAKEQTQETMGFSKIEIDQMPRTKGFILRCQLYVKDQKVAFAETRIQLNLDSKQQNKIALKKVDLSPTQTDVIMTLMWNNGKNINETRSTVNQTPQSGFSQKEIAQIEEKFKIMKVISYQKEDLESYGIKNNHSKRLMQEMPFLNRKLKK